MAQISQEQANALARLIEQGWSIYPPTQREMFQEDVSTPDETDCYVCAVGAGVTAMGLDLHYKANWQDTTASRLDRNRLSDLAAYAICDRVGIDVNTLVNPPEEFWFDEINIQRQDTFPMEIHRALWVVFDGLDGEGDMDIVTGWYLDWLRSLPEMVVENGSN